MVLWRCFYAREASLELGYGVSTKSEKVGAHHSKAGHVFSFCESRVIASASP